MTSRILPRPSEPTSLKASAQKEELLGLYKKLLLGRLVEERIRQEYPKDEMKTPVHLGIGEEAIPVGVCHRVPPGTQFFGTYRNHNLYLAVTGDTDGFFAELYGKATGPGKGKAGSMHLSAPAEGLLATSAVVGTTIPCAVGAALAHAYRGRENLVVAFLGDGALEEGVFWESLNFACLKRLKILLVCEDNGLAIHTPSKDRQGFRSIPEALSGFPCHLISADGSDLKQVLTATQAILGEMANDPRPGFLHFTYHRFLEHVGPLEDFDAGYRSRPSPEEAQAKDPLFRFSQELLGQGVTEEELASIREDLLRQIDRSVSRAQAAPFASAQELFEDLFANNTAAQAKPPVQRPKSVITFRQALNLGMVREMEQDPEVFVFGLDVPDHKRIFGSTAGLVEKFGPHRCFGTPLSEESMTGVALGAALLGLRPIHVHIRVDFALLAMNQIVNMISNLCYMSGGRLKIPLVIRAVIGRGWGQSAQHSKSLQGVFGHFPGLKVVLPTTPQDAYSLLRSAIREENPVIFLEHRWLYDVSGEVDEGLGIPLGTAAVRRKGRDLTVVTTSWMTVEALKAAEVLSRHGIELEVIDARSVVPLDIQPMVESVNRTRHCVVADYDWVFCGFAAELAAQIGQHCFGALKQPVERLGFAPVPCPTTRPLENLFYPSAVSIIHSVERLLGLRPIDLTQESFYSYEQRFKGPF